MPFFWLKKRWHWSWNRTIKRFHAFKKFFPLSEQSFCTFRSTTKSGNFGIFRLGKLIQPNFAWARPKIFLKLFTFFLSPSTFNPRQMAIYHLLSLIFYFSFWFYFRQVFFIVYPWLFTKVFWNYIKFIH